MRFAKKTEKSVSPVLGKPSDYRLPEHCRKGNNGRPCVYRGDAGGTPICEYILITGESRAFRGAAIGEPSGCTPEDCTHYQDAMPKTIKVDDGDLAQMGPAEETAKTRKKVDYSLPGLSKAQKAELEARRDRMRLMYEHGLTDREIAACMGCSSGTVATWRRREGLAPQKENRLRGDAVRKLWAQGLYDKDIAKRLGCSKSAVQRCRTNLCLAPNSKKKGEQGNG